MGGDEDVLFYAAPSLMSRADMRRAWKERPVSTFFSTGLGIGMLPLAPGTWGSLEGGLLAAGCVSLFQRAAVRPGSAGLSPIQDFCLIVGVAIAIFIFGIVVSSRTEAMTAHDPGQVVIDEVVGQMIACAPLARWGAPIPWGLWLVSFLLFRLFDVWKPGPIRRIQDLPGGWGIMADDVAAGIVAGALTFGIGMLWR
jgi:phosphatidylglycerophosphatase A